VNLARASAALALSIAVQVGLGRLWPESPRYLDLMLVPVVWYGTAGSQRAAMLVGCAAGLLQDSWVQVGVFGLNGFKKTLLGWALGGIGARFDLNGHAARLCAAVLVSIADGILDLGLRRMLDQSAGIPSPLELGVRALLCGVVLVWVSMVAQRARGSGLLARWV
jgi:cell shape-determining protein MreD